MGAGGVLKFMTGNTKNVRTRNAHSLARLLYANILILLLSGALVSGAVVENVEGAVPDILTIPSTELDGSVLGSDEVFVEGEEFLVVEVEHEESFFEVLSITVFAKAAYDAYKGVSAIKKATTPAPTVTPTSSSGAPSFQTKTPATTVTPKPTPIPPKTETVQVTTKPKPDSSNSGTSSNPPPTSKKTTTKTTYTYNLLNGGTCTGKACVGQTIILDNGKIAKVKKVTSAGKVGTSGSYVTYSNIPPDLQIINVEYDRAANAGKELLVKVTLKNYGERVMNTHFVECGVYEKQDVSGWLPLGVVKPKANCQGLERNVHTASVYDVGTNEEVTLSLTPFFGKKTKDTIIMCGVFLACGGRHENEAKKFIREDKRSRK